MQFHLDVTSINIQSIVPSSAFQKVFLDSLLASLKRGKAVYVSPEIV